MKGVFVRTQPQDKLYYLQDNKDSILQNILKIFKKMYIYLLCNAVHKAIVRGLGMQKNPTILNL